MMYLIGRFEKGIRELVTYKDGKIPETEEEICEIFKNDIDNFMINQRDDYHIGEIMKIVYTSSKKVGIDIYKI
jgi:hypothetical protein